MDAKIIEATSKAIARVQLNGADPEQPAVRWNGTEMEPQEFPVWHDFQDEARHATNAVVVAIQARLRDRYNTKAAWQILEEIIAP